jgi:glycine/D-amino acid oxidase-like deaminating enzyme
VTRVERDGDGYAVHTDRGTVWARHVVNATESHTPVVFGNFLDPFPDLITPYREQGMRAEGGPATMKPGVGVSGPLGWFARLAAGGFVFGSDDTEVAPRQAGRVEPSRFITRYRSTTVGENWEPAPLRVTHEWTGTTSTTPDKYPVIGRLDEHELYIIGGFAGAGSAASFNAGLTIANTILGRPCEPEYHPQEYFSPWRFTDLARYGRRQD